jgi:hypothetical protein
MKKRFLKNASVFMALSMATPAVFADVNYDNMIELYEDTNQNQTEVQQITKDEFNKMINNTEENGILDISDMVITLTGNVTVTKKNITIKGNENTIIYGTSANNSLYVNVNTNLTLNNITFNGSSVTTEVANENYKGKLKINNCNFINSKSNVIQFRPEGEAELEVIGCMFEETGNNTASKYISVTATTTNSLEKFNNSKVKVTIVGNTFKNIEKVTNGAVSIHSVKYENMIVGQNKVEDSEVELSKKISVTKYYAVGGYDGKVPVEVAAENMLAKNQIPINHEHKFTNDECECGKELGKQITDSINNTINSTTAPTLEGFEITEATENEPMKIEIPNATVDREDGESDEAYEQKVEEKVEWLVENLLNDVLHERDIEEASFKDEGEFRTYTLKIKKTSSEVSRATDEYEYVEIKVALDKDNIVLTKLTETLNKKINEKLEANGAKLEDNTETSGGNFIPSKPGNTGNGSTEEEIKIEFSDIAKHWAKDIILEFADAGYINGMGDGTFKPNEKMTRAQFVKVVNKYFGYTERATSLSFTDVETDKWYYDEILIGIKQGYIQGKSETSFDPNGEITREEVAIILTNIKNNKDTNVDKLNGFVDGNETSAWATSSVEGAIEAGYLQGDVDKNGNKTIRPQDAINRAEALVMLSRVEK